jgi:hypothetical protein|uniref:Uncharacterized protein n=1 Tax=viral metagenome TaxID=1070528 RepID=A0A6C0IJZ7_9ZZZZ
MDDVSVPSSDKITEMCDMISRQTDYTLDEIKDKLIEYNYNSIDVIKEYMGVQKEKPRPITSINQEIYKQIRMKLDEGIKDFNEKQYKKVLEDLTSDDKQE